MKKLLVFLFLVPLFLSSFFAAHAYAQKCGDPCAVPLPPGEKQPPNTVCDSPTPGNPTVWMCVDGYTCTGLGCISHEPEGLVLWFLSFAIKIAGGVALLLLVYGGIKFITSGGDPKALDEAKSTITSALSGLFLIIFAVLLLKVIGYDILRIPGWSPAGGLTLPGP